MGELLQNARRSGASAIEVRTGKHGFLTITDDGTGVTDAQTLLSFGKSGWNDRIRKQEHAAGMGLYSVARGGATVTSRVKGRPGWRTTLTTPAFEGKEAAVIETAEDAPYPSGTRIRFMPGLLREQDEKLRGTVRPNDMAGWAAVYQRTIANAAEWMPIPVTLNGTELPRTEVLKNALSTREAEGIMYGAFEWTGVCGLNFHGHLVQNARLAKIETLDSAIWVNGDVIDAPELRLTLPARDRIVENDFSHRMREHARKCGLEALATMRRAPGVPYQTYAEGRSLGIEIAPAPAELLPWIPNYEPERIGHRWLPTPYERKPVEGTDLIIEDQLDPETAATIHLACRKQKRFRIFQADERLQGYRWYNGLDRIVGVSVSAVCDGRLIDARTEAKTDETGTANAESIEITIFTKNLRGNGRRSLESDLILRRAHPEANVLWDVRRAQVIATAEAGKRNPSEEVVELLACAYLEPEEHEDDGDRHETRFGNEASEYAAGLFLGADAQLYTAVKNATADLEGVLPGDRRATIVLEGKKMPKVLIDPNCRQRRWSPGPTAVRRPRAASTRLPRHHGARERDGSGAAKRGAAAADGSSRDRRGERMDRRMETERREAGGLDGGANTLADRASIKRRLRPHEHDAGLKHTTVDYRVGPSGNGWYVTSSRDLDDTRGCTVTSGPYDNEECEQLLALMAGPGSAQGNGPLMAHEQVMENAHINRIEQAAREWNQAATKTADSEQPVDARKKALTNLLTATDDYESWARL